MWFEKENFKYFETDTYTFIFKVCHHGFVTKVAVIKTKTLSTACGCSAFGSVREDCEQMTGRCVCKPGIQGQKCTVCSNHEHTLGPNGCFDRKCTQLESILQ